MKVKNIQILFIISLFIFSCTKFDLPEKCNDPIPTNFLLKGSAFPTEIVLSKNDVNPLVVTVEGNYTANWTITGAGSSVFNVSVGQSATLLKTYPNGIYVIRANGKNSCGFNFDISKSIKFCVDSSPAEIIITANSNKTSTCTLKDGGLQKVDWTLVDKVSNESILVAKEATSATIDPIKYPSGNFTLTAKGKSECNIEFTLTKDYSNDYFDIFAVGENSGVNVNDIETDLNGNIYVTGSFKGVWVTTKGALATKDSESDFFVAKYSKFGVLDWIRTVESMGSDESNTIAVEPNGDFYISGTMKSIGYFGSYKKINPTGAGMFMAKYNTNGVIVWLNEGSNGVVPKQLVISNNGIIYLLGDKFGGLSAYFSRTDIPSLYAELEPNQSTFVIRYSSTGQITNVLRPSGSNAYQGSEPSAGDIAVDLKGNVYVCTTNWSVNGASSSFKKYNADGTLILTGGSQSAEVNTIRSISVDKNSNIYISAYFSNYGTRSPPSIKVGDRTITGPTGYFAKFNEAGTIQWIQILSGSSHKTDAEGNIYICGNFSGTYSLGTFKIQSNGSTDVFIAKFSTDGDILKLESLGGIYDDFAKCITLDKSKNLYVSGSFLGALNYKDKKLTQTGSNADSFILRFDK